MISTSGESVLSYSIAIGVYQVLIIFCSVFRSVEFVAEIV